MTRLVLVKHSLPEIRADVPAPEWCLSAEGTRRCDALADALRAFAARAIASSVEPKAAETATRVAERLGIPVEIVTGLHEHDRRDTKVLGEAEFERSIAGLFARPDELVFGRETAARALARFDDAVAGLLARARCADVIAVSHGTVIALFVAARAGTDGLALWKRLGLPSLVVLDGKSLQLERVVETIGWV